MKVGKLHVMQETWTAPAWVYRHDDIQENCTYRLGVFWPAKINTSGYTRADIND